MRAMPEPQSRQSTGRWMTTHTSLPPCCLGQQGQLSVSGGQKGGGLAILFNTELCTAGIYPTVGVGAGQVVSLS